MPNTTSAGVEPMRIQAQRADTIVVPIIRIS